MPRQIINLTELARLSGRHRTRLSTLVKQGRLVGDYIDNEGFQYWTPESAERIAVIFKEYEGEGKAGGRGVIIDLRKKKNTPKD